MNKISKKIVALATMAAFVLTLVPAAAFGAGPSVETSVYKTVKESVEVAPNEPVETTFDIKDVSGAPVDKTELQNVYVWATEEGSSVPTAAATFKNANGVELDNAGEADTAYTADPELNNMYYSAQNTMNGKKLTVEFARTGNFVLHAAVVTETDPGEYKITELKYLEKQQNVKVVAGDINGVKIDSSDVQADGATYPIPDSIFANDTATKTVTVTALVDNIPAAEKTFTIDVNNTNLKVTPEDTVTTDANGQFKLTYSAAREGTYYINLTAEDGFEVDLVVKAYDRTTSYPADITGSSEDVTLNVADYGQNSTFEDAVLFTIEDQNGEVLTTDAAITGEPATGSTSKDPNKKDYVSFQTKPDKFKGEATDFSLVWNEDKGAYTLQYKGTAPLVEGKYTVRVSLYETGENADVTFTLAKFDKDAVEEMQIIPSSDRVAYTAGQFTYKVVLIDKNGVQDDVTGEAGAYYMGASSSALLGAKLATAADGKSAVSFNTVNPADKEQAIGSVITLTAVSDEYGASDQVEVTITDEDVVAGLAFDSENGPANEDNTVNVSVVDADGNIVKVNGTVKAYVANSSNENANVDVRVKDSSVTNGKDGSITVFADEETTLDIVVAVVENNGTVDQKVYADTLTYTVGAEDVNADKLVAMTIGSSDYIVDNDVISGDAAPYVDSAWRTMVPVRVLAETLGGTVDYTDNVITIVDGDTTVVMTVGEETYTVNDAEKTMDTAPVIGEGDRTFVPIRFLAEALGYTVTPLQDANGLTASVVFQK